MRPLETKVVKETREKRQRQMISLILLAILVLSTAGYAFATFQGNNPADQTGKEGAGLKIGEQFFNLAYSREEVENINASLDLRIADYTGKNLYIDSNFPAGNAEIASSLGRYASRIQEACYGKCKRDLPEKNCISNLIIINSSASDYNVKQEENCVFIDGGLRAVDAFIYKVFQGMGK